MDQARALRAFWRDERLFAPVLVTWVASFGGALHEPVTQFYYTLLGASPAQVGALNSLSVFGTLILAPVFGWALDNQQAHAGLILCAACCAGGCLLRGVASGMPALYAAAVLIGLGANLWSLVLAFVATSTHADLRSVVVSGYLGQQRAMGLLGKGLYPALHRLLRDVLGVEDRLTRYRITMSVCTLFCIFGAILLCGVYQCGWRVRHCAGPALPEPEIVTAPVLGAVDKDWAEEASFDDPYAGHEDGQARWPAVATAADGAKSRPPAPGPASNLIDAQGRGQPTVGADSRTAIDVFALNGADAGGTFADLESPTMTTTSTVAAAAKTSTRNETLAASAPSHAGAWAFHPAQRWRLAGFGAAAICIVVQAGLSACLAVLWPLFLHAQFGWGSGTYGVALFAATAAAIAGIVAQPALERAVGQSRVAVASLSGAAALGALAFASEALLTRPEAHAAAVAALAGLLGVAEPCLKSLATLQMPRALQGRAWGVLTSLQGAGTMAGSAAGGWLLDGAHHPSRPFLLGSALAAAAALMLAALARSAPLVELRHAAYDALSLPPAAAVAAPGATPSADQAQPAPRRLTVLPARSAARLRPAAAHGGFASWAGGANGAGAAASAGAGTLSFDGPRL